MAEPPSLVACDLDGTLLHSDGTLGPRSRRALARAEAAGARVLICTARPARWVQPLASALTRSTLAICANGAVLWDFAAQTAVEVHELEAEIARQLVSRVQAALPGGVWAVERLSGFAHEPGYDAPWPLPAETLVAAIESLVDEPALKLLFRHERFLADALLGQVRELAGHLAEISHSNSTGSLLEIAAPGVSKASALARYCQRHGIDRREVIAFGDMPNDLPMLRWAGHSVAVANAHPDVRAAADELTASNDESGVALVLERVFGAATADGDEPDPAPALSR